MRSAQAKVILRRGCILRNSVRVKGELEIHTWRFPVFEDVRVIANELSFNGPLDHRMKEMQFICEKAYIQIDHAEACGNILAARYTIINQFFRYNKKYQDEALEFLKSINLVARVPEHSGDLYIGRNENDIPDLL